MSQKLVITVHVCASLIRGQSWHMMAAQGCLVGIFWPYYGQSWPRCCRSNGVRRRWGPIISTFPIMQPLSACYFIAALEITSGHIYIFRYARVITCVLHWPKYTEKPNQNRDTVTLQ